MAIPIDRFRSIFEFRSDGCQNFRRISERQDLFGRRLSTKAEKSAFHLSETVREQELDAEWLCSGHPIGDSISKSERAELIRQTFVNKGGKECVPPFPETAREQELNGSVPDISSELRFRNRSLPIRFPVEESSRMHLDRGSMILNTSIFK
ncbi:hypothetical protein CEXT_169551 [Caerostris extrusa]|uniref:Uncharacterized protein n=1 Tax=Caerostris extrusa TaxID=172846 RepID=A0AAV4XI59_CAEEX|nr:hypothetical protein CEXT_169551 [Caerostris extrusa]